jgi:cephalosporin hydroxylase
MVIAPENLERAASAEKSELEARVRMRQGGIATYFDVFLGKLLDQLDANSSLHNWQVTSHYSSPLQKLMRKLRGPRKYAEASRFSEELKWLATHLENKAEGRFVSYDSRVKRCRGGPESDIRSPERMMSQGKSECLTWKGSMLFKTVFDFAIFPMLLWELRPGTIFEIGSGTGASAKWMADLVQLFGLTAEVHSTDKDRVEEEYPGVHFLSGNCCSPQSLFPLELLRDAPRPYLVVEDAHINVAEVLCYIDPFLTKGDYLLVEDSLLKRDALNALLQRHPHSYLVDTRYTDYFGRNATSAINSIFVRV